MRSKRGGTPAEMVATIAMAMDTPGGSIRRWNARRGRLLRVLVALALAVSVVPSFASGKQAVEMQTFDPHPVTTNDFGIGPNEVLWVKAPDGADIYVEVTKPIEGPKGIPVPERFPVVLRMTPYRSEGARGVVAPPPVGVQLVAPASAGADFWRKRFVPKGYIYADAHSYGSGNSEGCLDLYGAKEIAAISAVVEELGRALWSNGRVGFVGGSYDGGSAAHAAALGSDAAKRYLAAIAIESPGVSFQDQWGHDGVPTTVTTGLLVGTQYGVGTQPPGREAPAGSEPDPVGTGTRQASACRVETEQAAAEYQRTGDFSSWFYERSARRGASSIDAATLMIVGFHDGWGVMPAVGFFDQIPKDVPHKLVLGQWAHGQGSRRVDWDPMIQAWFDRYLLDLPVDTESWPQVQVQDSTGAWRSERDWPGTGGPLGQLALNAGDTLGGQAPTGSSTYLEASSTSTSPLHEDVDDNQAVFTTAPLAGPLHLAGQPVLDLWIQLDGPDTPVGGDAHVAAVLSAFTADGTRITSKGGAGQSPASAVADQVEFVDDRFRQPMVAQRSVQHLDPIRDGFFQQAEPRPAPVGAPFRVPMRFYIPIDLVVPEGGWITIKVAGTNTPEWDSMPSGRVQEVRILHDCAHPSALRFVMPKADPEWLDVPMKGTLLTRKQEFPLPGLPTQGLRDGGGLATAKVCGKKPLDPQKVLEHPWIGT